MIDQALQLGSSPEEPADKTRRRLLVTATSAMGAVGTVALVTPLDRYDWCRATTLAPIAFCNTTNRAEAPPD